MLTISIHLPKSMQTDNNAIINFNDWASFSAYIRKMRIQENYTVVFSNLDMLTRKEGAIVKSSKDSGYWIVELMERNV